MPGTGIHTTGPPGQWNPPPSRPVRTYQLWHDLFMAEHEPDEPGVLRKLKPLVMLIPAHAVVTALAWRDLRGRSPEQLRGSKRFWRVVSGANTLGSLLYFTLGRKRAKS